MSRLCYRCPFTQPARAEHACCQVLGKEVIIRFQSKHLPWVWGWLCWLCPAGVRSPSRYALRCAVCQDRGPCPRP